jgi:hypothetical protein
MGAWASRTSRDGPLACRCRDMICLDFFCLGGLQAQATVRCSDDDSGHDGYTRQPIKTDRAVRLFALVGLFMRTTIFRTTRQPSRR